MKALSGILAIGQPIMAIIALILWFTGPPLALTIAVIAAIGCPALFYAISIPYLAVRQYRAQKVEREQRAVAEEALNQFMDRIEAMAEAATK